MICGGAPGCDANGRCAVEISHGVQLRGPWLDIVASCLLQAAAEDLEPTCPVTVSGGWPKHHTAV